MKINTKFWVMVSIISLAIILGKSFKFTKKKHLFERDLVPENNLKAQKISILDSINEYDFIYATNNIITIIEDKKSKDSLYNPLCI